MQAGWGWYCPCSFERTDSRRDRHACLAVQTGCISKQSLMGEQDKNRKKAAAAVKQAWAGLPGYQKGWNNDDITKTKAQRLTSRAVKRGRSEAHHSRARSHSCTGSPGPLQGHLLPLQDWREYRAPEDNTCQGSPPKGRGGAAQQRQRATAALFCRHMHVLAQPASQACSQPLSALPLAEVPSPEALAAQVANTLQEADGNVPVLVKQQHERSSGACSRGDGRH